MLPNVHLLGIQGSGKGTQSAFLVERLNLTYLPSGDLFRARAEQDDELARHIQTELQKGHLLPDELLRKTVEDFLESHTIQAGVLGDGVLRKLSQVELLQPLWAHYQLDLPLLIHLELTEEEAKARIRKRIEESTDPAKKEFHLKYSGKLLKRNDDNPQAIEERFALFHHMTEPIIAHFSALKRCVTVSAVPEPEQVFAAICKEIHNYYPGLRYESH